MQRICYVARICVVCYNILLLTIIMRYNTYCIMKTLVDLGVELKQLRQQTKMTQEQVAAALGMRQEALSRFERGHTNDFSVSKLLRLAQTMGYDLQFVPQHGRPTLSDVLAETRASANTGPTSR